MGDEPAALYLRCAQFFEYFWQDERAGQDPPGEKNV